MTHSTRKPPIDLAADAEERAAAEFVSAGNEFSSDSWRRSRDDPGLVAAQQKVERVWQSVGSNANRPEFLALREQALARLRRANRDRWSLPWTAAQKSLTRAASVAGVVIAVGGLWQLSTHGFRPDVYRTGIGEQRTVELSDHSQISLDANTTLRVTLTAQARTVELSYGQAEFSVARESARPFKVIAGGHAIVAIGTVFTVDYTDQAVHVAMMEGRVAILTQQDAGVVAIEDVPDLPVRAERSAGPAPQTIELSAGEELRYGQDGKATVTVKADLEAATAWREGKVIFRAEPLGEAVRRLNRYSHTQLKIDGAALSNLSISGVFEASDSRAFAAAVQAYLPVIADDSQSDTITLRMK